MEIDEKKIKEILGEQREEYQRYLGVVAEDFQSQVRLVAESVMGTQEQLVALRDLVAKNSQSIEAIRDMVAKNTEDIEVMKMDLQLIKNDLKEKVSRDEFKILERRVDLVEKKLKTG